MPLCKFSFYYYSIHTLNVSMMLKNARSLKFAIGSLLKINCYLLLVKYIVIVFKRKKNSCPKKTYPFYSIHS